MSHPARHTSPADSRLPRLLDLLKVDPENASLISEAAATAYDDDDIDTCSALLDRLQTLQPLPADLLNLRGLVALSRQQYEQATQWFDSARQRQPDPVVTYNLAYAYSMEGHFESAAHLVDETIMAAMPVSISLKMRALHHLGKLDEMIALGSSQSTHPQVGQDVCGLLATGLFDAGDIENARQYAAMAQNTSDGCSIGGMLALDDGDEDLALTWFSQALRLNPQSSRAKLGEGLGLLAKEDLRAAACSLDQAAQLFATHAGTWVAAGWAHLLQSDLTQAQTCFERAMAVDRSFAEAIGGLALVCLHKSQWQQAAHYAEAAIRLDSGCLSGALAQSLLLANANDPATAEKVHQAALQRPLGPQGKTIARALAKRAIRSASPAGPHAA